MKYHLKKHLAEGYASSKVTLDGFLTDNRWDADCFSLDFHLLLLWEQCCPQTKFIVEDVEPEGNSQSWEDAAVFYILLSSAASSQMQRKHR